MNLDNRFLWYKLTNVKGLGSKSLLMIYNKLARGTVSIQDIFRLSKEDFYSIFSDFGKGKFSKLKYENFHNLDEEKIFSIFEQLQEKEVEIIPIQYDSYPKIIKKRLKINSPTILYCKGNLSLLKFKSISIVGSRHIDEATLNLAKNISSNLAKNGYNIVSGYAKGVDTMAHLGALEVKKTTSIILPLGINNLSIKRDFRRLEWKSNSLFISNFPPNEKWRARNAMERNKIIAALSEAIVIITSGPERDEKGRMSGTFNTGKTSLEMNIPVYVLSPSLFDNPPKGNIDLITLGGIEVKTSEAILTHLLNYNNELLNDTSLDNTKHQLSLNL